MAVKVLLLPRPHMVAEEACTCLLAFMYLGNAEEPIRASAQHSLECELARVKDMCILNGLGGSAKVETADGGISWYSCVGVERPLLEGYPFKMNKWKWLECAQLWLDICMIQEWGTSGMHWWGDLTNALLVFIIPFPAFPYNWFAYVSLWNCTDV